MNQRILFAGVALAAFGALGAAIAPAQNYPVRPIRIIVGPGPDVL